MPSQRHPVCVATRAARQVAADATTAAIPGPGRSAAATAAGRAAHRHHLQGVVDLLVPRRAGA